MQNHMNWNHPENDPILNHIQRVNSGSQKHLQDGDMELIFGIVRVT